jgi:K+-transporting ATPase ATPase C chain
MRRDIVTSIIGIIVFTVLIGLVYPLFITGVSQVVFPGNANGQKVYVNGKLVGSKIIGQSFKSPVIGKNGKPEEKEEELVTEPDPRYFQSRPSATEGGAYNAAASTFSNRGPNDKATEEADAENICEYLHLNKPEVEAGTICENLAKHKPEPAKKEYDPGLTVAKIPVDAVNTSASNLDPEISQANAWIQAYRVAAVRHLPLATVDGLISKYTDGRGLGFSGEEGVNVLELNLALDRLTGGTS